MTQGIDEVMTEREILKAFARKTGGQLHSI